MIQIIPAVLAKDFKDLEDQISRVRTLSKLVQIDVVDGSYARTRTWPYRDHATFDKIVEQEHGLPYWEELDFEFDLMIADPLPNLMRFVEAGASSIIIHAGSPGAPEALQKLVDLRQDTGAFVVHAGLALAAHVGSRGEIAHLRLGAHALELAGREGPRPEGGGEQLGEGFQGGFSRRVIPSIVNEKTPPCSAHWLH